MKLALYAPNKRKKNDVNRKIQKYNFMYTD